MLVLLTAPSRSQEGPTPESMAEVKGIVADATGAVIPQSKVVFKGESGTVVGHTSLEGAVTVELRTGMYDVTITKTGFVTAKLVDFQVNAALAFRVVLQVDTTPSDGGGMVGVPTITSELPSMITRSPVFHANSAPQTTAPNGAGKGGSLCVLPNSPEAPTRISPGGEYNPNTLRLRVDQGQSFLWPHKEPVLIDGLDLQDHHLVVLTSDGKRIQSLRFRFSVDDDAKRCIYFDGYQGVQLGNKKNALWCRAKNRACWP